MMRNRMRFSSLSGRPAERVDDDTEDPLAVLELATGLNAHEVSRRAEEAFRAHSERLFKVRGELQSLGDDGAQSDERHTSGVDAFELP